MTDNELLQLRIAALEADFDSLWELASRMNRILRAHQTLIFAQSRALIEIDKQLNKKRED